MKRVLKYIAIFVLVGGFLNSCETTELDLRVSPNDLSPDQADPNLLLTSIQLAYGTNQQVLSDRSGELVRIDYMGGRDYFNNYPGSTLNGVWSRVYSSGGNGVGDGVSVGILTNLQALEAIDANSEVGFAFHLGVAKTLYAHSLIQLVDFLGAAAFSQAGNPTDFPAPLLDNGQDVYNSAMGLLNEAEALLAAGPSAQGAADIFYNGDTDKWVKLINTIRLKVYYTTGNVSAFNSVISGGNYISDIEDDFQITYGTSELQPDDRHPDYAADYTPSGANIYQSNWMMETMLNNNDPRIRYYFYRQVGETPGADADPNEETLACSLVVPPQHFQDGGYTYCAVPEGYWGRTHGNDEGTPPDNFLRTAVGVYPAGGKFDADLFRNGTIQEQTDGTFDFEYNQNDDGVGLGQGAGGAGIEPIFLSSYVDFWRAYMAMNAGNTGDAATFMEAGLRKSIEKVQSFVDPNFNAGALLDSSTFDSATGVVTDPEVAGDLVPTSTDVDDFIAGLQAAFNAGDNTAKWNILAEQYFTTMYGGSTEAWTFYRLSGYPTTLVPNWEPNPGPFPRTFLLPQNEVITNPNLSQKATLTEQVFWDTNPASPTFPVAN
ncbi:SusD/RagB family nutrient-binding outer membrane lipoprotein [Robiginitalea sp. M366]|uniref:SusD/RagB family nutrient-binding outer membrane lipoprotein n=1 Tax=Robiginitalea aestuariiviva TaxID=3036903 RepID=UPI00240E0CD3|nr:SusD/RagB family nutrient-binding outer membrane lipoprotein [Robiginitalea aestuariiviva]MDG1572094.1 SusD/RagB family nutrient-binding outer membrane lipoprotein [Robiginitalea aestuariiviva]